MVKVMAGQDEIRDIELMVFDKDGTLIDLYTYWSNMIALRAERLCEYYGLSKDEHKYNLMNEMGVDIKKKRLKPEGPVGLLPRNIVQKAAEDYLDVINCSDVSTAAFDVFKEVDKLSLDLLDTFIKPIKGATELLQGLKEKKCRIAIATTDKTERARLAVEFLNMADFIDIIVGADKVKNSKPSPDMLEVITEELKIAPVNSVMIGDAETDVRTGINAGFKASIGVCSGLTDKKTLMGLTQYVVSDVSEIKVK
ncbi:MAG: HAD family hydrolase [Candidatus Omnitrophota bacterium]